MKEKVDRTLSLLSLMMSNHWLLFKVGYVKDVISGEITPLCKAPDEVHSFEDAVFISNQQLVYVTNQGEEYSYAVGYDYNTETELNTLTIEGESISEIKWHKDSQTLYAVIELGVENRLYQWKDRSPSVALPPCFNKITIYKKNS